MSETALTLRDTMDMGEVLAQSGYFSDAKGKAQAVVKVLAGREMGFGPIASMTGVHIVQGKPTIGANLLGAAIKGSGRYNYRVVELTNERAEIAFFEHGEEIGRSVFTMQDAQQAGLAGKGGSWKMYPRNMLFSRAISNGARWYCPDVFSGVTPYTPEEMGAEVDEQGEVIDVTPTPAPVPESVVTDNGDEPEELEYEVAGISSPAQLLDRLKPIGYYQHGKHALAAYNKMTGEEITTWPANDARFYDKAYALLVDYARANQAQDAIKETAEQARLPA